MARLTHTVIDGKAVWNGRTLSQWLPEAVGRVASSFAPRRVIVYG